MFLRWKDSPYRQAVQKVLHNEPISGAENGYLIVLDVINLCFNSQIGSLLTTLSNANPEKKMSGSINN